MQSASLYDRIRAEIEDIGLIDTHEHLVSERVRLSRKLDLFEWFSHYASSDLVSAGLSDRTMARLQDPERPLEERWVEFAPYWEHVRTTGYGRTLLLAARDLFGIEDINGELRAIGAAPLRVLDLPRDTLAMLIVADFKTVPVLPGVEVRLNQPLGFVRGRNAGRLDIRRIGVHTRGTD